MIVKKEGFAADSTGKPGENHEILERKYFQSISDHYIEKSVIFAKILDRKIRDRKMEIRPFADLVSEIRKRQANPFPFFCLQFFCLKSFWFFLFGCGYAAPGFSWISGVV